MISRRRPSTAGVLLLGVAAASAGAVILLTGQGGTPPAPITLDGIPPDLLEARGITLSEPAPGVRTSFSAEQAAETVRDMEGIPVKQTVLAQVQDSTLVPPMNRTVWVVSLDVSGLRMPAYGPPGSPPDFPFLYHLIFIDPDTGARLYSDAAAGDPK